MNNNRKLNCGPVFLLAISLLLSHEYIAAQAQPAIKSISIKKGEVLDIILAANHPDNKDLIARYRKTAIPVALEYSYKPQPSFAISRLVLGNYLPQFMIMGKWVSKAKKEAFLDVITQRVPDFHAQRQGIFRSFQLTSFVLNEDLNLEIDTEKTTVCTAFWEQYEKDSNPFIQKWIQEVKVSGGTIMLSLHNGTSPVGYGYGPDTFIIVQWAAKEAFEAFSKAHPLGYYNDLKDVHQFQVTK